MKARILAFITLIAVLVAPVAGVFAQGNTLVDVAAQAGNFTTLLAAVEAAGLVDTLKGDGPFTVFAPTDEAFAKVPRLALDYLLAPENKDLLVRVLTYHVVAGENTADKVVGAPTHKTVEGGDLRITVEGDTVKVNSANVTQTDIAASNGVIHVIDAVILPTITLPEVDPLTVSGNILTAGSSTVFPLTRRIADLFRNEGFADNVEVASVGTGAGFERFCKAGESDISNASRPIKSSEVDDCRAIGREPIGFYVAIDALAVAVSLENDFVYDLTKEQLAEVFAGKYASWKEVNPDWPEERISLFSPGTDSGTFDYFVEEIFKKDKGPILNAPGIQLSEDDNVLVQGVAGSKGAIGYFGYAYYPPNRDKIRAISVEGIEPNETTAETGIYPLARPLFIYSTAKIMQEKPQVAAYINFYLTNASDQLGTGADKINYFAPSSDAVNLNKLLWLAAMSAE